VQEYARSKVDELDKLKQIMDSSSKDLEGDRIKVGYLEVSEEHLQLITTLMFKLQIGGNPAEQGPAVDVRAQRQPDGDRHGRAASRSAG